MKYEVKRLARESDDITNQSFQSYNEAYNLLTNIYEDIYCSDADYDDKSYYEIIEINVTSH
tara:strand:- start:94 stop:276 length:183 start_codon:yes stop_codon:yes gene_type:complete